MVGGAKNLINTARMLHTCLRVKASTHIMLEFSRVSDFPLVTCSYVTFCKAGWSCINEFVRDGTYMGYERSIND